MSANAPPLPRRLAVEALGSGLFILIVLGAASAGEELTSDPAMWAVLSAVAAAGGLFVIMTACAPISGGHINPVVTLVMAAMRRIEPWPAVGYMAAQYGGGVLGAVLAYGAFGTPTLALAERAAEAPLGLAEAISVGMLALLTGGLAARSQTTMAVGIAVFAGISHLFTLSFAFADPAVTLARAFTSTAAGLAPAAAFTVLIIQVVAGAVGAAAAGLLFAGAAQFSVRREREGLHGSEPLSGEALAGGARPAGTGFGEGQRRPWQMQGKPTPGSAATKDFDPEEIHARLMSMKARLAREEARGATTSTSKAEAKQAAKVDRKAAKAGDKAAQSARPVAGSRQVPQGQSQDAPAGRRAGSPRTPPQSRSPAAPGQDEASAPKPASPRQGQSPRPRQRSVDTAQPKRGAQQGKPAKAATTPEPANTQTGKKPDRSEIEQRLAQMREERERKRRERMAAGKTKPTDKS